MLHYLFKLTGDSRHIGPAILIFKKRNSAFEITYLELRNSDPRFAIGVLPNSHFKADPIGSRQFRQKSSFSNSVPGFVINDAKNLRVTTFEPIRLCPGNADGKAGYVTATLDPRIDSCIPSSPKNTEFFKLGQKKNVICRIRKASHTYRHRSAFHLHDRHIWSRGACFQIVGDLGDKVSLCHSYSGRLEMRSSYCRGS